MSSLVMSVLGREFPSVSARLVGRCRRKRWNAWEAVLSDATRPMHTMHKRRELPYPIEDGVGDFLPPNALKTVVEWQDGLFQRLNEQVRGTELAKPTVLQIIIDSAGDKKSIRAFNYACLAANNSFFLDNLKPPGTEPNERGMSVDLRSVIASQFMDVDSLKERFVAAASGMVSSGWLWLVTDSRGQLAVIPTFGAGTLLVRSGEFWQAVAQNNLLRQPGNWLSEPLEDELLPPGVFPPPHDGPSPASPVSGTRATHPKLNPHTPARSIYSSAVASTGNRSVMEYDVTLADNSEAQRKLVHKHGSTLYPLCCLSLYEHTWMSAGLGVWGKEEYVRRFFNVVNWEKISDTFIKFRKVAANSKDSHVL